jgi:hypothetical protein
MSSGSTLRTWLALATGLMLLGGTYAWSLWRTAAAARETLADGTVVVRLAHFMLEPQARAAFAATLREFEQARLAEGRPVVVRPIEVPERTLAPWLRTQLVGGTAPEIVMLRNANSRALNDQMVARYLVPLSPHLQKPNPRNAGTPLAATAWQQTFYDGLELSGINFRLNEHYAVPLSAISNRLLVNHSLLREILAHPAQAALRAELPPDGLPQTYDQFIRVCAATVTFSEATGRPIFPLAGSSTNTLSLLGEFFSSQTQGFIEDFAWSPTFRVYEGTGTLLRDMATGRRHLTDYPAIVSGYHLLRDVGRYFQPGFLQHGREDAQFLFGQERALMVSVTSTEAGAFTAAIGGRFDIGVIAVPAPHRDHPVYGEFVLGRQTEANASSDTLLSLVSFASANAHEAALDLVHYLTSLDGNTRFATVAELVPSVLTAEPAEAARPFVPRVAGYPPSYEPTLNLGPARDDFFRLAHLLFDPRVPLGDFIDAYEARIVAALPRYWRNLDRQETDNQRQLDLMLNVAWQEELATADPAAADRTGLLLDVIERLRLTQEIRRAATPDLTNTSR